MNDVIIGYVHGFNSACDWRNPKVQTMKKAGYDIRCINYNTFGTQEEILEEIRSKVIKLNVDVLIGTSLGGWAVTHIGLPYVAINPVFNPAKSAFERVDTEYENYVTGELNKGTLKAAKSFTKDIDMSGNGIFMICLDDEVLDHSHLKEELINNNRYVVEFAFGGHRCDFNKNDSMHYIKEFVRNFDIM